MRLTALQPPPPTPITMMTAGEASSDSSSIANRLSSSATNSIMESPFLRIFFARSVTLKQFPEHSRDRGRDPAHSPSLTGGLVPMSVEQQACRRRPFGPRDDIHQASDPGGEAAPHRTVEDPLGDLDDPLQLRSAARQDDTRTDLLGDPESLEVRVDEPQELLGPRLQDLRQGRAGAELGRSSSDHRHLDHLVLAD